MKKQQGMAQEGWTESLIQGKRRGEGCPFWVQACILPALPEPAEDLNLEGTEMPVKSPIFPTLALAHPV